jgi:hypothetical protein
VTVPPCSCERNHTLSISKSEHANFITSFVHILCYSFVQKNRQRICKDINTQKKDRQTEKIKTNIEKRETLRRDGQRDRNKKRTKQRK